MLELSSSGSVRGVPSNGHPYRDPGPVAAVLQAVLKLLQISLRLSREPFDALAIHPAAPWLRATFHNAASRVVGRTTLSIRLYHLPPLTPLPSADTMRSVQTDASVHHHWPRRRASAPCVAFSGTLEAACCFIPGLAPPTSCLPSLGAVLLPPLSTARGRIAVL